MTDENPQTASEPSSSNGPAAAQGDPLGGQKASIPPLGPLNMRATPMDRMLLTLPDQNTQALPYIGAILHVAGAPPRIADVRAEVTRKLTAIPALTAEIDAPSRRWTRANGIDLDRHVLERKVAPGQVRTELVDLLHDRLPDGAPLWQLWLLSGYASDEYILVFRVHHSLHDASGMLHTLETLFSAGTTPATSSSVYHGFTEQPDATLADRYRALAASAQAVRRPASWRLSGMSFSTQRSFHWVSLPRDVLKSTARAHGGSCNDVYLAAFTHALSVWHARHATERIPPGDVPLLIPTNVRRPQEVGLPGNSTAFTVLQLPGDVRTIAQRLDATVSRAARLKSPRDREAQRRNLGPMFPASIRAVLNRTASPAVAAPLASSIVLRHDLAFRSDPVVHVEPIMWAPRGIPLGALTLTYRDTVAACFITDSALSGLDHIHHDWLAAAGQGPTG